MGRTALMVEYEFRMFTSSLKMNIKKPSYVLTHAALFLTCLFVGYSFASAPEYFLMEAYPLMFTESETIARDMLATLFALLLLYTVVRGFFDQGLRSYIRPADFDVMVLTPINSRCIFLAKFARTLVSRLFLAILAFLVIAPISLKLDTPPLLLAGTLVSLIFYIEFLQAISFAVRSMREAVRSKFTPSVRKSIKVIVVAVSSVVPLAILLNECCAIGYLSTILNEVAESVWVFLPSSLTASLVLEFMLGRTEAAYPSLLWLGGFLAGALALIYAASGPYHPEEFAPDSFSYGFRSPLGFRLGRVLEKQINWKKPSLVIFMKDIQLALRGALIDFSLLDFTVMYGVTLAAWYLLESFLPFQMVPDLEAKMVPLKAFVREVVIVLALLPFIPSLASFSREMGKIWLLKVFPLKNYAVAFGKFLFSLTISAASLAPMAMAASLVFEIQPSEWTIGAVLPLVLLVANSFGVLVGAHLPLYDLCNHVSLRSMITFFMLSAVILAPFMLVASNQNILVQVVLLVFLALYSIAMTIFFLGQAGKGFEKLELREILPHQTREIGPKRESSSNGSENSSRLEIRQ